MIKKAYLVLDDGSYYEGDSFGSEINDKYVEGEIVFNTTMDFYENVIKNPAYFNKIVVFTYPPIGNLGASLGEREKCYPTAVIVKGISRVPLSNSNKELLDKFLQNNNVVGIENIDTRMITKAITKGNKKAIIINSTEELMKDNIELAKKVNISDDKELVSKVSTKEEYTLGNGNKHIGVLDLGVEQPLLQFLISLGYKITVFPYNSDDKLLLSKKLDFLILSNGPGNPTLSTEIIATIKKLIGKIPIIGIAFGSAIVSLALGFKVTKLKVGHFGDGHTIINQQTKKISSTIQSHIYITDEKSINNVEITYKNFNDNSIEAYKDDKNKIVSLNFFPKSANDPILEEIFKILGK